MKELEWLLLASILLSWLVASMVLRRAEHWQLVQAPNHRSSHVLPPPNGGGLGIVTPVNGGWVNLAKLPHLLGLVRRALIPVPILSTVLFLM